MSFHQDEFHQNETKTLTWHMNDMNKKIHELLKMIQDLDGDIQDAFRRIADVEERFVEER